MPGQEGQFSVLVQVHVLKGKEGRQPVNPTELKGEHFGQVPPVWEYSVGQGHVPKQAE